MKFKKVIAVLICILLAVSLAACGKGSGGTSTDTASQQPAEVTQPAAKPEEPKQDEQQKDQQPTETSKATPEMDFDLGGRTIKIVAWWDMSIQGEDPASLARKENLESLMKKHNFKVEYEAIDYNEYHDRLIASLMAGQPLGDIVRIGKSFMIPSLVKQDFFHVIELDWVKNDKVFNQKFTRDFFVYNGKGYAFTDAADMATGIIYNKTLMNKLGLKPLQEYVDEDKWTWETFIEVAKSANRDTNNDGKTDTWGLASGGFLEQALAANETDLVAGNKQNLDDPKVIETLNFISRLNT